MINWLLAIGPTGMVHWSEVLLFLIIGGIFGVIFVKG